MTVVPEQYVIDFDTYPPIGDDDWRYIYAAARVRALEETLLPRSTMADMANAANAAAAIEMLGGTEYMLSPSSDAAAVEQMLLERRAYVRSIAEELIEDEQILYFARCRIDFANMRLAIRRVVTDKPIGTGYTAGGNVPVEQLEQIFEQEDYHLLPEYLQCSVEQAIIGYYNNRDIRQIDYSLDAAEACCRLEAAVQIGSIFLTGLFRIKIDLNNIRTMLRLKFSQIYVKNPFIEGGFIEPAKFRQCLEMSYEQIPPVFSATPYRHVLDGGVGYFLREGSFLKLEAMCDQHLLGFLATTRQITAGLQPITAYILMKEHEIRMLRMILTAKRNSLEPELILNRLGE